MLNSEEEEDDTRATNSQRTSEKRPPLASERNSQSRFPSRTSGKCEYCHELLDLLFWLFFLNKFSIVIIECVHQANPCCMQKRE